MKTASFNNKAKRVLMGVVTAAGLAVGAAESGYSWRGYMLDVSRHFFTVDEVKKTLDAMAVVKLNVFHWHLTDDTGWRIQIDAYPELVKAGATMTVSKKRTSTMGAHETDGAYGPYFYTKDEIRDVVAYAAKRGITVVPEIDIPGHSGGAIRAYPALACGRGRSPSGPHGGNELCVGKDETLRMYERILDEVLELFPSKAIHLGGDECNHKRWQQCPDCQRRIREHGLRGEKGLQGWFMTHFAKYLEGKGRRMVAWDDVFECAELPKGAIAMAYRTAKNFAPAVAARGYDVVMTCDYYWDYVQGLAEDPYEYQPFGYNCTWQKVMRRDPAADFPPEIRRHLIGVQGCMWTELVCDIAGVEWRTWPRMAALADVMLNGPASDEAAFAKRLEETNGKLKALGVNVAPLGPLFAEKPVLEEGVRLLWQREDFAKMLPNPLDASVMCFDWKDRRNAFSKIYARLDPRYPSGAYLMDMDWLEIEVTASDETGFENARRQLRKLARMKKDGVMEFPSCRLAFGDVPPDPIVVERDLKKKTFVGKSGAKLDYRWREPRHMQLGANYPLQLLFGGTDAEVAAFLADVDARFEEMFVCVLPYHADRALVDELVAELGWSIRCMNGKAVRRRDLTDTDPTAAKRAFLPAGTMTLGANYWGSAGAVNMWRDWKPEEIEKDFAVLKAYGFTTLRVFPNWRDFQPIVEIHPNGRRFAEPSDTRMHGCEALRPDDADGDAGMDPVMLAHFDAFCELAEKHGMKLVVAALTGQMTFRLFVPPAIARRDCFADPYALAWEGRFLDRFVRRMKHHKAIVAWQSGNETRILADTRNEATGEFWLRYIHNVIRLADPERPITAPDSCNVIGSDSSYWSIRTSVTGADIATVHPYKLGPRDGELGSLQLAAVCPARSRLAADVSGLPAFVEEHGIRRTHQGSGERLAGYMRSLLWNLWAGDCRGLLWWCAFDQTDMTLSPYGKGFPCQELGAFTRERKPLPNAEAVKAFAQFLSACGVEALPPPQKDAVFILGGSMNGPICTDGEAAQTCWTVARQAGVYPRFHSPETPIADAPVYFFPDAHNRGRMPEHRWAELREKVRNGATLCLGWHTTYLTHIEELFGVRAEYANPGEDVFSVLTAEVVRKDEKGRPILYRNRFGRGVAYLAVNHALSVEDVALVCPVKRLVTVGSPSVLVSDHFVGDDEAYAVVVNSDTVPFEGPVEIAGGWKVDWTKTDREDLVSFRDGKLTMAPDTGVLIHMTR